MVVLRSIAAAGNLPGMEKVSLPDFFFLLQSELNRERFTFLVSGRLM